MPELIVLIQILISTKRGLDYTNLSAARPKQLQLCLHVPLMKERLDTITFWKIMAARKPPSSHCFHEIGYSSQLTENPP